MTTAEIGEEFISHHGVLGMKWGVRKERIRSGARAVRTHTKTLAKDIGFELGTGSDKNRIHIAVEATDRFEKDLPALKARHGSSAEFRTRIKSPLSKEAIAYRQEARDTYLKHLEDVANEQVNASGDRQRTLSTTRTGIGRVEVDGKKRFRIVEVTEPNTHKYLWEVRTREVQHADQLFCKVEPIFDSEGFITTVKPVADSMSQSAVGEDFISHHGILGMKWGERHQHSKSPQPVQVREAVGGNFVKTRLATSGGESHPAHPQAVQIAATRQKLKKSGVHTLSNDELQALIVRGNLEQQAHSLETRRSVGRQFVEQQKAQATAHPITSVRRIRKGVKAVSLALPI